MNEAQLGNRRAGGGAGGRVVVENIVGATAVGNDELGQSLPPSRRSAARPWAESAVYAGEAPRLASCPARRIVRGIRRARETATRSERRIYPAAPSSSTFSVRSSPSA